MNNSQKITHVIERLSLGARPGDHTQVQRMGVETYIRQQLNPDSANEPAALTQRLSQLPHIDLSPKALFAYNAVPKKPTNEERSAAKQRRVKVAREAVQARLLRALESNNQLQEVMVDFWFNHFNVYMNRGIVRLLVGSYEHMAIRPHAMGKFRDLLGATAKHPAMLSYLDNWLNTSPNSPRGRNKKRGLNENYARELLELHTMGVDGGYTQADVENLTRILTGWSIAGGQNAPDESGFRFEPNRHDPTDKVFLGQQIASGGVEEGERALDLIARHPSTARHISYKLAQHFVGDQPPAALVDRLSERFRSSDGDIRVVLSDLFESDEFWSLDHYQTKFKTPYQYVFSIARAVGLSSPSDQVLRRLNGTMRQLSMPLYECRPPDGYAQVESAWLNADAMMRRTSLSTAVYRLKKDNRPAATSLISTLGDQLSENTLAAVNSASNGIQPTLILGSPEMMYR
ncbi:DUF1800 domain-containing protein [cf. Phormidesmis sp. LEGE 11477]|uniref:DUF1800 domain-containing protein n=1 Tax=cf. Phormidesmis sp. LEGE 11477 TaxID=1828680 RepID=UPI001881DC61|nr:DUF1800 domain-containing protein [cf. Phormidesmis sp. LEGE 11477]